VRFIFELDMIPPHLFIVIRFRHPTQRRQALSLPRRAPKREGLWDRDMMARIGQRVFELEEGTEGYVESLASGAGNAVPPPEEERIGMTKVETRTSIEDAERAIL
jgi:hypothetical protein